MRDDQRQRLLSGGCGEELSWAEPASSYPEQIGALTYGFRLSPADPDRSGSQRQDPPGVVDRSVTYARTMGGTELDRYYFHSFEHWPSRLDPGSQAGSHRWPFPGDVERSLATIDAVRCLIERRQATSRDGSDVPSKQRVAGSNPAGRAIPEPQVSAYVTTQTSNVHDALPRCRARCMPDGLVSGRFSSAAARLLSASAMTCRRSSLPCR